MEKNDVFIRDIKNDLQEISQDVKLIVKKVHAIEIETAVNTRSLEEHMRRTEASENRIEKLEDRELEDKNAKIKDKLANGSITAILLGVLEAFRRLL